MNAEFVLVCLLNEYSLMLAPCAGAERVGGKARAPADAAGGGEAAAGTLRTTRRGPARAAPESVHLKGDTRVRRLC